MKTKRGLGISFREMIETSDFTREKYDRTRALPDRIKYTDIGKRAVTEFVDAADERHRAENPEHYEFYTKTPSVRYSHLVFMFCKYMMEADIQAEENASHLHIMRTPGGKWYIVHNFLNPGALGCIEYMLDGCKELISEKAKD